MPAINVLLLGTDGRTDETDVPRTDTMILLTLDPQNQTAGMLSLPRDLWIPIPGLGYSSKINTAYQLGESVGYPGGGRQLTKDTVSSFIGQPVQYYVRVNFQGFEELIDLIGGVEVVVPATIHDEEYPTEDYGYQTFHLGSRARSILDGETALKYVRTRNVDDDYSRRGGNSRSCAPSRTKCCVPTCCRHCLPKVPRLLYTMRSSIETDIPMAMQLELANYVRDASLREVRQLVLDSRYGEETYAENGAWILLPDRALVRSCVVGVLCTAGGRRPHGGPARHGLGAHRGAERHGRARRSGTHPGPVAVAGLEGGLDRRCRSQRLWADVDHQLRRAGGPGPEGGYRSGSESEPVEPGRAGRDGAGGRAYRRGTGLPDRQ